MSRKTGVAQKLRGPGGWDMTMTNKAKIELCVIRQIFDFKYLRSDKLYARFHRLGIDKNGQILPVP